jgi:FAD/FMN-containing dehydrogenase
MTSLATLDRAIDGDVWVRGTPDHDRVARPFNARFDGVVPEAVVSCASAEDVAETVSFIRRLRLESAARSGGHCFAGRSSTAGILIDVSRMRSVSVWGGLARVGAGARLGEVYAGLMAQDLAIPGGTCPSVGVAGLTLGGGLGFLGRTHGATSDRLVGARIVLADGRIVECDAGHDEQLFWALRGAGTGGFGVVTELVFRPIPRPPTTNFHLTWSFSDAADVTRAWLGWTPSAPDEVAASLVMTVTKDPDESPSVEAFGTVQGNATDTSEQLEAFTARVDADPVSTFIEEMPYREALQWWADRAGERLEDPRAEARARAYRAIKSEFFARPLPPEAIDGLLDHFGDRRSAGQARDLDFTPWGGAYNRVPPNATAFVHRDELFSLKHSASVDTEASAPERGTAREWVTQSWEIVRPWGSRRVFPNFPDPDLRDWGRAYYGANLERLLQVKARYDPENVFRFAQSLPLA